MAIYGAFNDYGVCFAAEFEAFGDISDIIRKTQELCTMPIHGVENTRSRCIKWPAL